MKTSVLILYALQRVVGHWNRLPGAVVMAKSCQSSRGIWAKLSDIWSNFWEVLCEAWSWTQMISVSAFQLGAFYGTMISDFIIVQMRKILGKKWAVWIEGINGIILWLSFVAVVWLIITQLTHWRIPPSSLPPVPCWDTGLSLVDLLARWHKHSCN